MADKNPRAAIRDGAKCPFCGEAADVHELGVILFKCGTETTVNEEPIQSVRCAESVAEANLNALLAAGDALVHGLATWIHIRGGDANKSESITAWREAARKARGEA